MKAIKYIFNAGPIFVHFKKHYCPRCHARLKPSFVKYTVNSKSDNAKNYDFSNGDSFFAGDVEFRERVFFCPTCDEKYPIKAILKQHL